MNDFKYATFGPHDVFRLLGCSSLLIRRNLVVKYFRFSDNEIIFLRSASDIFHVFVRLPAGLSRVNGWKFKSELSHWSIATLN